jgi:shikimate dehydrogenase
MIQPVQTDIFAVIGNPVKHSLSPAMMNGVFKSLNIPAVYLAFQVDAFEEDMQTLHRMGIRGLSVTLPHKEAAFRAAVAVDDTADAIGAVNTLRRSDSGWEGRNTDWLGANRALREVTPLTGKHALVLGAGGVARAVVYGLEREGVAVTVSNRTIKRGEALAKGFQCAFIPLPDLNRSCLEKDCGKDFDLVVQCTSVGLPGEQSAPLLPESFFHSAMTVMDTVYRPFWTPFMLAARKAGCRLVSGAEMLLYQGVAQLEWWLERTIPASEGIQVMRDTLARALTHE